MGDDDIQTLEPEVRAWLEAERDAWQGLSIDGLKRVEIVPIVEYPDKVQHGVMVERETGIVIYASETASADARYQLGG